MCGIVGYVGPRDAVPILIGGLEKLEYRGYDSAGVASCVGGEFDVYRSKGKLANLKESLKSRPAPAENGSVPRVGIGHTRWATHGRPSETNAHPHVAGNVCVVHNGIIENYVELRERLQKEGCRFASETDTEIAAHLINSYFTKTGNLRDAVRDALKELQGSYALVVISKEQPDRIVIARNATPVIIGIGEGENYIASDIPALLDHTRKMMIVEDDEIAEITPDEVLLEKDGQALEREPTTITWDPITAEKGGFRHFMLKEIHEQPQVVTDTFRGRIDQRAGTVFLDDVVLSDSDYASFNKVTIVACGTAWHAGLVAKFYIERLAKLPVEVDYGSEFRYRTPLVDDKTLFIVISQSGETADTLGSLRLAKECGSKTLAICNVVGSTISREVGSVLYTHAGPEISVASTKAFVTQLTAAYLLALQLAISRKALNSEEVAEALQDLVHLPSVITSALTLDRPIEKIAKKYGRSSDWLYLGRGILYPIALEGALKLKEISYLHAEGYPAGEMKHGPIALIDEETPVVVAMGRDGVNYEKVMSNLREVESRGGRIIAITDVADAELREVAWEVVEVGPTAPLMLPMALTVPLQLLAYHVAVYRGTDVDQPRNLAKSVTVE
ncbi:MAG: glutamine--fructose-6-phosphate transaminase (isomerizing) [Bdellovibrionales bacterium]|nr:glutamine--fructose-6-phosphate transaminase (isomerizing) [Bdellovibrionales bacterium]